MRTLWIHWTRLEDGSVEDAITTVLEQDKETSKNEYRAWVERHEIPEDVQICLAF